MPQRKKDIVRRVQGKAEDFAELAGEKIGTVKIKTKKYIEKNPLKSVAIAVGIGAVIGAVVALGIGALIKRKQPTVSERIRKRVRDWL